MIRRRSVSVLLAVIAALVSVASPAMAATPGVVWDVPGQSWAVFSADGSLALATGNSGAGGRLEIRQAATGALVRVLTSPFHFNAVALSADKQVVAVTLNDTGSGLGVHTIRLYRVSDGTLLRAIPTVAARSLTSLDLSTDGQLVAAMDARSAERGGQVHVHRVSDGGTVRVLTVPGTTAAVRFSPDGRYLATNDRHVSGATFVAGVRVFRTADWSTALTLGDGSLLVRWTPDSTGLWIRNILPNTPTTVRLVTVPSGAIQRSVTLNFYDSVSDVTEDNATMLVDRVAAPRRTLTFTSTLTGTPTTVYDFGQDVFAGDLSPDGTRFAYTLATPGGGFHLHVAAMP